MNKKFTVLSVFQMEKQKFQAKLYDFKPRLTFFHNSLLLI